MNKDILVWEKVSTPLIKGAVSDFKLINPGCCCDYWGHAHLD